MYHYHLMIQSSENFLNYLQRAHLIVEWSQPTRPKIYLEGLTLAPNRRLNMKKRYYQLNLAQNLHLDLRIWVDDPLVWSHDVVIWLSGFDFEQNVLILTLVDDFE